MSFITQRRAATFFIVPLFAGLMTACQEQPKEPDPVSLDTPEQRLSYGIALRMGRAHEIRRNDSRCRRLCPRYA